MRVNDDHWTKTFRCFQPWSLQEAEGVWKKAVYIASNDKSIADAADNAKKRLEAEAEVNKNIAEKVAKKKAEAAMAAAAAQAEAEKAEEAPAAEAPATEEANN